MGYSSIRPGTITLRGAPIAGENPQPRFRESRHDLAMAGDLPEDKYPSFGRETAFRVLPYRMQDRYDRDLKQLALPSIVMENDYLRAEFLPSLGGRLWSLYDKQRARDLVYRNPVLHPANLAIRDAWFSGGIEWNIGRLGHSVHTCSPVFAGVLDAGGEPCLRLWEFERQTRLYWRVEFRLPENSPILFCYARIENPDPEQKPLYWWTNAAVPQTKGVRVLSATDVVIYIVPGTGTVKTMGYAALPSLPVLPGADASYPVNSTYSNEYFFQNDRALGSNPPEDRSPAPYPWESAVYEDGYAYAEASTAPLVYRKMFCWGRGRGGQRWQDFLSLPGEEYLEVQAGLAPTQLHTADIAGGGTVDWVQAFTAIEIDPAEAHQADYRAAAAHAESCLVKRIPPAFLETALTAGRAAAALPAGEILHAGTGWGALERRLNQKTRQGQTPAGTPAGLLFPDEAIGEDEAPWAELLRTGTLPLRKAMEGPGSFAVHENWEALLKKSLVRTGDWLTPYHLGVMAFERGDREAARDWWKRSLEAEENPWAYRNLGIMAEPEQALEYFKKAFELSDECSGTPTERTTVSEGVLEASPHDSPLEDYIRCLLETHGEEAAAEALDAYMKRRDTTVAELSEGLREAAARIALSRGDDQTLDLIFSIEPAHIREGNTALMEIWLEREAARLVRSGACAAPAEAKEKVRSLIASGKLKPPENIDFRMY